MTGFIYIGVIRGMRGCPGEKYAFVSIDGLEYQVLPEHEEEVSNHTGSLARIVAVDGIVRDWEFL